MEVGEKLKPQWGVSSGPLSSGSGTERIRRMSTGVTMNSSSSDTGGSVRGGSFISNNSTDSLGNLQKVPNYLRSTKSSAKSSAANSGKFSHSDVVKENNESSKRKSPKFREGDIIKAGGEKVIHNMTTSINSSVVNSGYNSDVELCSLHTSGSIADRYDAALLPTNVEVLLSLIADAAEKSTIAESDPEVTVSTVQDIESVQQSPLDQTTPLIKSVPTIEIPLEVKSTVTDSLKPAQYADTVHQIEVQSKSVPRISVFAYAFQQLKVAASHLIQIKPNEPIKCATKQDKVAAVQKAQVVIEASRKVEAEVNPFQQIIMGDTQEVKIEHTQIITDETDNHSEVTSELQVKIDADDEVEVSHRQCVILQLNAFSLLLLDYYCCLQEL